MEEKGFGEQEEGRNEAIFLKEYDFQVEKEEFPTILRMETG